MEISKKEYNKLKKTTEMKLRAYPIYKHSGINKEVVHMIEYVLKRKSKETKKLIKLTYFTEGLTTDEIAKKLNLSRSSYYLKKKKILYDFIQSIGYL